MVSAASRGLLLGACAGLVLALNDFGALWLWLDMGSDRWALLNRTLGLQVPICAAIGLLAGLVMKALHDVGARVWPQRSTALRLADTISIAIAPGAIWVAWQLFTGGTASRLPAVWLLRPTAALVLSVGAWIAVVAHVRLFNVAKDKHLTLLLAGLDVLLAHALIKLNQWVLPNLYNYLHGTLTVVALALLVTGIGIAAEGSTRLAAFEQRGSRASLLLLVPFAFWLALNVQAMPTNQNVAVSLLDARAAHSRTLMLAVGPLLQPARAGRTAAKSSAPRTITAAPADAQNSANAHLLLITVDALRADHLGTYGYGRPTSPHMDQLAARSLVFDHAYTQAPHSSYSLSSLMTSEYLHETLDLGAPPPEATIATALAGAGYQTSAFYTLGIFHTAAERLKLYEQNAFGFALHDHRDREPEALTDRVLEEIDRAVAQGEPNTFVWAHYFNVHEPYRATTFGTSDMDRYDSEIVIADAAIDRLIREGRKRFKRDLVVVITADHGEEFREHGGVYHGSSLYEEQVRVPLIVSIPGVAARHVKAPVELVDVAPTLLGALNVARPDTMRGDDLRGLFAQETPAPAVFSAVIHKRMVVIWPHKLIADLRFGLYELYALDEDPSERKNLAGSNPALLDSLRGEIYGWLDSLASTDVAHEDPRMIAIDQGRLGDRRAVPTLIELIQDETAPVPARREAGAILSKLVDPKATTGLRAALKSKEPLVAAEAAIALGRMQDPSGRDLLRSLVASEDPDVRSRAAVSLARLRDVHAVPALIDALWVAPNDYEREEAIRWLGRLRDPRALEPLISLLPESRTRHLVVVALGAIGDARAFETLRDVLRWEGHSNIRDNVGRALGMLKDPRGLELVLTLATQDATLKHATEALVRLNAIEQQAIGGSDIRTEAKLRGFHRCTTFSETHDWDYLHRTVCETARDHASVELSVPESIANDQNGFTLAVAMRRLDQQAATSVRIQIGDVVSHDFTVDGTWSEQRVAFDRSLPAGHALATLTTAQGARLVVDHVLLLPR